MGVKMSPAERIASAKPKRKPGRERRMDHVCRVRERRKALRLTLDEVCEALGISKAALSYLERGATPTLERARKLAEFFGVTVDELWPEGTP